jgi:hypothetical protein
MVILKNSGKRNHDLPHGPKPCGLCFFLHRIDAADGASAQSKPFWNWIVGCDTPPICMAIVFAEPSKAAAAPGIPFLQIRHHPHRAATQDCGVREHWGWSKGGTFELIERREMPLCRAAGPAH